jgi:hypothetical protein
VLVLVIVRVLVTRARFERTNDADMTRGVRLYLGGGFISRRRLIDDRYVLRR